VEARTRDLIAAKLGVPIVERGETYRSTVGTGLEGDWLGAFMQPGVIVSQVTPMRVTLSGTMGRSVDEYGPATLTLVKREGDRVTLTKRYDSGPSFVYVGRLGSGTLAGYWQSPLRPAFSGVFWLARTESLAESTLRSFEGRVRRWSLRRGLLYAVCLRLAGMMFVGLKGYHRIALISAALWVAVLLLDRGRANRVRSEVARWKELLG
jgi:hypothetical protein